MSARYVVREGLVHGQGRYQGQHGGSTNPENYGPRDKAWIFDDRKVAEAWASGTYGDRKSRDRVVRLVPKKKAADPEDATCRACKREINFILEIAADRLESVTHGEGVLALAAKLRALKVPT